MNALEGRWHRTWADLRLPQPAPDVLQNLLARYREPHRAYHTVQHLEECFALLDELRAAASDPAIIELALWYHDAVYRLGARTTSGPAPTWPGPISKRPAPRVR